jgi:hypothetical protein
MVHDGARPLGAFSLRHRQTICVYYLARRQGVAQRINLGALSTFELGLRENWCFMIKYPQSSILCAVLTSFLWSATATPSQADTGTLRVVFGKAGLVAAVGSGEGILTFHGKHYAFLVAGASIGATLAASTSVLRGTALNISTPGDLAGTYTGVGGGAAVAAGVSGVRLHNEKGVVLELRGAKLGVEASANLALITITMK